MRWLKREMWKAGIALAGTLLFLGLMMWVPVSEAGAYEGTSGLATPGTGTVQATPTEDATVTTLNKEKLAQEVQQLKNQNAPDFFGWLRTNAAILLSTLVVVIGGLIGFFRWLGDRRDEQEKRRENQHSEQEKRAEERFQKVVEGLGSERMEAKVGAAITLRTFLQPGYEQFYRQAFDLAVAHLRLRKAEASASEPLSSPAPFLIVPKGDLRQEQQPPPSSASIPLDSLSQALITVFKESFPRARNELKKTKAPFDPRLLDAANVQLDHAYLTRADLVESWLLEASLREAVLAEAQLQGANLSQAQLQGANLDLAQLQGAYLFGAQLQGVELRLAQLQGAHLFRAQLQGAILFRAQLDGADLDLAQLDGADLTETNPEAAYSLEGTQMNGVTGLTPEQRELCIKKGAIFDAVQQAPASDTSSSSSLSPSQNDGAQAPSVPPAQVSAPTPDTAGSSTTPSKPDTEP